MQSFEATLRKLHPHKKIYHSIGYSDDENLNVEAVCMRAEKNKNDLERKNIHFVIYDTKSLLKHVITEKREEL